MTLLEECISSLGINHCIIDENDKGKILDQLYSKVNFTKWGRINHEKQNYSEVIKINDLSNIKGKYFVMWDEATLPIIYTEMHNIISNLDDVLAVSFNTWLIAEDMSIIIEFYHDGIIRKFEVS